MRSPDFDLEAQMGELAKEWREAYESGIVARSYYATLAASSKPDADLLDAARERLDRIEALKARIAAEIAWVEDKMLAGIDPWRSATAPRSCSR